MAPPRVLYKGHWIAIPTPDECHRIGQNVHLDEAYSYRIVYGDGVKPEIVYDCHGSSEPAYRIDLITLLPAATSVIREPIPTTIAKRMSDLRHSWLSRERSFISFFVQGSVSYPGTDRLIAGGQICEIKPDLSHPSDRFALKVQIDQQDVGRVPWYLTHRTLPGWYQARVIQVPQGMFQIQVLSK